ncbi:hypothetical protein DSO57_1022990 [Entomophthora muscae]|uniref:Uncharacterized protein n=1 Tax=Entomophthora muscae TaxID=34485 RepID=A0ACC2T325_9FUNG|nr:hypothetical protein DSO57_1022990 [Entomophthora muscae]
MYCILLTFCIAFALAGNVSYLSGGNCHGWLKHTTRIVLGQGTHWIKKGSFGSYHLKLGAKIAGLESLRKKANFNHRNDHLKDERQGFFFKEATTTRFYRCASHNVCSISLYLQPNNTWIPHYAVIKQGSNNNATQAFRDAYGRFLINHVFQGPAVHAVWVNQLHWHATATAKYFTVIRHIGGYCSTGIGIMEPLFFSNGDPDAIFGYWDYPSKG